MPIVSEVSKVAPEKAPGAITPLPIVSEVRRLAPRKASTPIEVTLSGIISEVRELAPKKALLPIEVTLFGIVSEVREVAPRNALLPIEVTLFGIITVPAQPVFPVTMLFTTVKKPEVQETFPLDPARGVTTIFEAEDAVEGPPARLVAVTVNVYCVPAVRPVTEIVPLPGCEIVPVIPPGDEVAVYEVIAAPPSETGAVNETVAVVVPVDVAITDVGAPTEHVFVLP